jgi:hypothetical protein
MGIAERLLYMTKGILFNLIDVIFAIYNEAVCLFVFK